MDTVMYKYNNKVLMLTHLDYRKHKKFFHTCQFAESLSTGKAWKYQYTIQISISHKTFLLFSHNGYIMINTNSLIALAVFMAFRDLSDIFIIEKAWTTQYAWFTVKPAC